MKKLSLRSGLTLATLFLFLICSGIGVATRNSYVDECEKAPLSPDTYMIYTNDKFNCAEAENEKSIIETLMASDIIIRAEKIGDDIIEYESMRCTLRVLETYQGNVKPGEEIDFYTFCSFGETLDGDIAYYNHSYFNIMQNGHEYIVFANKKEYYPSYEEQLERKIYEETEMQLSWFRTEFSEPPLLSKEEQLEKKVKFIDIKDNEFNCFSEEQRTEINKFKKKLLAEVEGLSKQ